MRLFDTEFIKINETIGGGFPSKLKECIISTFWEYINWKKYDSLFLSPLNSVGNLRSTNMNIYRIYFYDTSETTVSQLNIEYILWHSGFS